MTSKGRRRALDMMGGLDAAGRRMAGGANERLERGPIRVPVTMLLAGLVMLAGAFGLAMYAQRISSGGEAYGAARTLASLLYAGGGLSTVVGIAGLLSALVVHIVERRGRRP